MIAAYCILYIQIYCCTYCTHAQILLKHGRPSMIKKQATKFNFKSSQIVGRVQRFTGKKWKASLDGSAQVSTIVSILIL